MESTIIDEEVELWEPCSRRREDEEGHITAEKSSEEGSALLGTTWYVSRTRLETLTSTP